MNAQSVSEEPLAAIAQEPAAVLSFPAHCRLAALTQRPLIIGHSEPMKRVLDRVARLAPKNVNVLVLGETGTGKELIAAALHALSERACAPFIRVNCGAIPDDLVEAELFGHTRGAFSGAVQSRPGFFGAADRGTLVLDEIDALPAAAQATLLRAVDCGELQTVGAAFTRRVDVRIVACTNADLAREVAAGRFRSDLYYRLSVADIALPPLRERREDIEVLASHFAAVYARRFGTEPVNVPSPVLQALQAMPWPGNVRELENAIARIVALSCDGHLSLEDLAVGQSLPSAGEPGTGFRAQVAGFERRLLHDALAREGGNHSAAARALGLRRSTFLDLIGRHGLK